jgi:hypothetical protein
MIKLKNILAENMRRFGTKNLNEDDNSYKANQEYSRLNKIANAVITKLRANSTYDIDVEEDEDFGSTSYQISQTIPPTGMFNRLKKNKKPTLSLMIDPTKADTTSNYVNVETGKLYVTAYENGTDFFKGDRTIIDIGAGMFSTDDNVVVNKILDIAKTIFELK